MFHNVLNFEAISYQEEVGNILHINTRAGSSTGSITKQTKQLLDFVKLFVILRSQLPILYKLNAAYGDAEDVNKRMLCLADPSVAGGLGDTRPAGRVSIREPYS